MTRFRLASLSPSQIAAQADETSGDITNTAALVAALAELRHHLMVAQPAYVFTPHYTFGGTTTGQNNPYSFKNPYDTPAQYRVVQVAFTAAGTAALSDVRGTPAPTTTQVYDPTSMTPAQVFAAPGALTVSGSDNWSDIPGSGELFLAVAVTAGTALAVVQFRRRVSPAGVYAEGHN